MVSRNPGWPRTHRVAEDALQLPILLPAPSECWHYRHVPTVPTSHGTEDQTQVPQNARKALSHLSRIPSPHTHQLCQSFSHTSFPHLCSTQLSSRRCDFCTQGTLGNLWRCFLDVLRVKNSLLSDTQFQGDCLSHSSSGIQRLPLRNHASKQE